MGNVCYKKICLLQSGFNICICFYVLYLTVQDYTSYLMDLKKYMPPPPPHLSASTTKHFSNKDTLNYMNYLPFRPMLIWQFIKHLLTWPNKPYMCRVTYTSCCTECFMGWTCHAKCQPTCWISVIWLFCMSHLKHRNGCYFCGFVLSFALYMAVQNQRGGSYIDFFFIFLFTAYSIFYVYLHKNRCYILLDLFFLHLYTKHFVGETSEGL